MADISRADAEAAHVLEEAMYATAHASECSVCMRQMTVRMLEGQPTLACPADAKHEGYRKRRSLSQLAKEGYYIPYVSEWVQRKKEEKMEPESRELAVYGSERLPITQTAAEKIIRRLWPKASDTAAGHAMLLAVQENLNPLNHELYIVPFKNKDGSVSEVVVLGIEANRKMARRRTPYSYKDGPRPLTAQEMEDIGEDPKVKVGVVCVLETPGGAIFPGYGFWPKASEPYGSDKGNTKFNMASYRAERNALKRVMPDNELPAPVGMVIDGVYADISEIAEQPKLRAPAPKLAQPNPPPAPLEPPQAEVDDPEQRQKEVEAILDIRDKAGISSAQFEKAMRARPEFRGITDPWKLSASQRRVLRELVEGAAAAKARTAEAK